MKDVSEGTIRIAEKARAGECFHFSTDRYISIRDVVGLIASMMPVRFEDAVEIVNDRPGKDAAYLLDSSKARTDLEWNDNITLEQGITEVIEWAKLFSSDLTKLPQNYIHKP
jgi:dTDP-glucose 4,6-dehydratase